MTGNPRRQHAVEHIDTTRDHLDELIRLTEPHRITWFISRQVRRRIVDRAHHLFLRLADADATDRITIELHLHQPLCALLTQVGERAALHDREQQLLAREIGILIMPTPATLLPIERQLQTLCRVIALAGIWRALIESHDDIAAECRLNLHRLLRTQEHRRTIEVTLKPHAVWFDLAQLS